MSFVWSALDLANIFRLPQSGVMLMIECYFDDSGTHDGSPIVVWGGVVGTVDQFKLLDESWAILLNDPLPGKTPLSQFHLSACRAAKKEFSGYNEFEREQIQKLFCLAIAESGVAPVAFGVDVSAWNVRVAGRLKAIYPAESAVFGECAKVALALSEDNDQNVSVYFDQGRQGKNQSIYQRAREIMPEGAKRVVAAFLPVAGSSGLQAADVVANYFYRHAQKLVINRNAVREERFNELLENSESAHCGMFFSVEIDHMVTEAESALRSRGVVL